MELKNYPEEITGLMEHHGHLCFGVLMGYKACKYAVEILGPSDKMIVTVEKENCGNDAVSFLLGCTKENGKLIITGGNKEVWSFYNPDEEEGIRLTVNPGLQSQLPQDKDQAMKRMLELPGNIMFMV
ncbi:MAG TPA: formylmethanofuran dehydrogenase subunit E family protein, partial [Desulfobacteria bacterium]|nr:formylmethanofuran dehydrogenase subunit E family protein [Desulfobacteria bacterium]